MTLFIAKIIVLISFVAFTASINNNDIKNQVGEYEVTQLGIEPKPRHMASIFESIKHSDDEEILPMGRSLLEEQVYELEIDAAGNTVRRSLRIAEYQTYREDVATTALYWAFAAYCWADKKHAYNIKDQNCRWCHKNSPVPSLYWPSIEVFRTEEHQGYVGVDKDDHRIVVSLRGTDSKIDMITNFEEGFFGFGDPRLEVEVHAGYYTVWNMLKMDGIKTAIEALMTQYPTFTVVVVGHSLGGAVAQLCAYELATEHKDSQFALYTFGSPRVGNEQFATQFAKLTNVNSYRIVWGEDPVVNMPLNSNGYSHIGRSIKYPNSKKYNYPQMGPGNHVQCTGGEDSKCASTGDNDEAFERYHNHYFYLIDRDEVVKHVCQAKK